MLSLSRIRGQRRGRHGYRPWGRISLWGLFVSGLAMLGFASTASAANPTSLLLPQSTAFSILGVSCGGIQERAFATGFDATSGYPVGAVYLQTRCGGSGRGGGYRVTTYSAWAAVTWDFAGAVSSYAKLVSAPTGLSPTFSVTDAAGDRVYNLLNLAYLTVVVAAAPTGVTALQAADQFQVDWSPAPVTARLVTSSTVTATPVGSAAPVLTSTVSGNATSAPVGPLQPSTTYQITVVNSDAGGSSPASSPISITSQAASVVPSAPASVSAHWTAPGSPGDTLVAGWAAAAGGNSLVDQYQVTINGSDGGGTFTQTVTGSTLTATFAVSDNPNWAVTVRAHNAAGWGPWSTAFTLGGA